MEGYTYYTPWYTLGGVYMPPIPPFVGDVHPDPPSVPTPRGPVCATCTPFGLTDVHF